MARGRVGQIEAEWLSCDGEGLDYRENCGKLTARPFCTPPRSRAGLRARMGGVLRPRQSRAPYRGGPNLAAVALDMRVRYPSLSGHRGRTTARRMLFTRGVFVRRRRPRKAGRRRVQADRQGL